MTFVTKAIPLFGYIYTFKKHVTYESILQGKCQ